MKNILAEIITIGDELLDGQSNDTNRQWLCQRLTQIGSKVIHATTVGDEEEAILAALAAAEQRANIILLTGGLGPTKDDRTKSALARYFESPLALHEQALADITAILRHNGLGMTATNKTQAMLPTRCTIIRNSLGTAPGMWFDKQDKVFISLPGVPHEMHKMVTDRVLPGLQKKFSMPVIYHKVIHTVGIAESYLADKLQAWEEQLPDYIHLAYLPGLGTTVKLGLTVTGKQLEDVQQEVAAQIHELIPLIGEYMYGYDDDTLEAVVGRLLQGQGKTLATAESCSGGYVAHMITRVPGSSAYYQGGLIPYQNEAKINVLGVQEATLAAHTAVSEETAIEMAQQVQKKFRSDIGLASTGIAGPSGGSREKPVGTVWIAVANGTTTHTQKLQLGSDRLMHIQLTAIALLDLLRKILKANNHAVV